MNEDQSRNTPLNEERTVNQWWTCINMMSVTLKERLGWTPWPFC